MNREKIQITFDDDGFYVRYGSDDVEYAVHCVSESRAVAAAMSLKEEYPEAAILVQLGFQAVDIA